LFDTYAPGQEAEAITTAETDGRVLATADKAEILGGAAILESGSPSNIGSWTDVKDGLQWTLRNVSPGAYGVSATVSIPRSEAGSRFEVLVDGSVVSGSVPGTNGWTDYTTISLGQVTISHSGEIKMTLQPKTKVGDHVMNLRSVVLTPVK
jgi:hypothetical protein